jgi:hypothetical protein
MKNQQKEMSYLSSGLLSERIGEKLADHLRIAHFLIVGSHGSNPTEGITIDLGTNPATKEILYGDGDLVSYVRFEGFDGERLAPHEGKLIRKYRMSMQ